MKIFFDFDGTLIDVSERYYQIYCAAINTNSCLIPFEIYWNYKRERVAEEKIIQKHHPEVNYNEYEKKRIYLIEDPVFLKYDILIHGARDMLDNIKKNHDLYLVTLRNNSRSFREQLKTLTIESFFTNIENNSSNGKSWERKIKLIQHLYDRSSWIIGDTEADVKAGQMLGMRTCAVLSGIRNKDKLKELNPNYIISTVIEFPELLEKV